ncbi:sugar transferase [Pelistega europaea]|uniref:Sugar transferase n=1 Tax=Pelistega europaea TaxID=106147 RepID=A0A7Y4LAG5_9BURK|nr:sugar transferase [Pelistega europaea]NOL49914.1 sugar transferase [Pelistega europaea]
MSHLPVRRHSRWYERVFFSTTTQIVLVALISTIIPAWVLWRGDFYLSHNPIRLHTFYGVLLANIGIIFTLRMLLKFPGNKSSSYIISTVITWYILLLGLFFIFRLGYSLSLLFISFCATLTYGFVLYFLGRRWIIPKIAVIPLGRAKNLILIENATWYVLTDPDDVDSHNRFNMIVTDLHSSELTAKWQKYLADCVLNGLPVYNARQVEESLTGRVRIHHMYENQLGSLLPSYVYSLIKRTMDIVLTLVALPVALPIMVLAAICIFLEDGKWFMFSQPRVGKGNKEFMMYKFRSMRVDSEKNGAQFADEDDERITRVGKIIRKLRIDELPQLFNVLKGDMSLIGPRPEQRYFADQFEKQIPFYAYRHIVRPGISGWAQCLQGYAADVENTQIKLEYDFYYIKHFSLWLDVLIIFKTVKIILTGFGAR